MDKQSRDKSIIAFMTDKLSWSFKLSWKIFVTDFDQNMSRTIL